MKLWRRHNWGIKKFLKVWVQEHGSTKGRNNTKRVNLLQDALEQSDVHEALALQKSECVGQDSELSVDVLTTELDALISQPFFGKFDLTAPDATNPEQWDFTHVFWVIESTAPTWAALIKKLLSNCQQEWESYQGSKSHNPIQQRTYLITSVICRSCARKTSNFFAKGMGLFLLGSGAKRRVVEVFAGMGICDTYKYSNQLLSEVAAHEKEGI